MINWSLQFEDVEPLILCLASWDLSPAWEFLRRILRVPQEIFFKSTKRSWHFSSHSAKSCLILTLRAVQLVGTFSVPVAFVSLLKKQAHSLQWHWLDYWALNHIMLECTGLLWHSVPVLFLNNWNFHDNYLKITLPYDNFYDSDIVEEQDWMFFII